MPSFCFEECTKVDFNTFPNGTAVEKGAYIHDEWKADFGMEIFVVGLGGLWSPANNTNRWWALGAQETVIEDATQARNSNDKAFVRTSRSWFSIQIVLKSSTEDGKVN